MTLEPLSDEAAHESRAYRRALGAFATGVCVVTADDAKGPLGVTVNSFASVSLNPRLIVWSIDERAERREAFAAAERFAVHVLGQDAEATAKRFARGDWRLAADEFMRDDAGGPPRLTGLLGGVLARFDCTAHRRLPMGDHLMIVGRVEAFEAQDGAALTFHHGRFGHSGETA